MRERPEGRRLVRRMAFRELAPPELYQAVLVHGFVDLGRRLLRPCQLSAEQEVLLRKLGDDAYVSFTQGQLSRWTASTVRVSRTGWTSGSRASTASAAHACSH